jgi:hypothetical protein
MDISLLLAVHSLTSIRFKPLDKTASERPTTKEEVATIGDRYSGPIRRGTTDLSQKEDAAPFSGRT